MILHCGRKQGKSSRMNNGLFPNVWKSFLRHGDYTTYRFHTNYIPKKASTQSAEIMPKDRLQQLLIMQRQRQKNKKKSERFVPSTVSLQVLGSGARGAPRSLYVSTDHTKYLFNCGEGSQRLSYEHRLRLGKLEHIFVTTPSWANIGGLPGLALTIQDAGVPEIKIHGPAGCSDLFKAVERFVILKNLDVSELVCSPDEPFVDQTMTVRYVPLFKAGTESSSDSDNDNDPVPVDDVDYYAYEVNGNGKRSSSQERNRRKIPRNETTTLSRRITGTMAYICKLHPKRGTLLLDKCVDKGVPSGPLLGYLKAGKDIALPDGTVVLSSEVTSPMDPGPVFIVLECPDEDYLDVLVNCGAFEKHQAETSSDETAIATCVIHFTPEKVMKDPRYRRWMEKFGRSTRHMIINEENNCMGSEAVHRIQHQLHLLHPTIFPFLDEEGITIANSPTAMPPSLSGDKTENNETSSKNDNKPNEEDFPLINRAKTLDTMHLRPPRGFDTNGELTLTPRQYIDEAFVVDGFLDALAELQTEINARETKNGEKPAEYPKIVMLGTGSCIPNKTRNTSGILLRVDEETSIVFDCGEATAGQLVRFYGSKEVDKVLSTIKAVYISHLHADHHIGLVGLLNERARVTKEPVTLLAPEQIGAWLRFYHKRFEPIADKYALVSNKDLFLVCRDSSKAVNVEIEMERALKGMKFSTVRVKHCPHAFGVLVTLENGCKIVYSGDTMPCDGLVELGMDCDLLIHEATMEDELEAEARTKYHSTISQAITVGERMRAKFILLTHFSQRYSKIPHLPDSETSPNLSRVGIAYDNMQVSLSQLNLLPLLYPSLKLMFSEFCTALEEKALKRQIRLEREARELRNKIP